MTMAMATSIPTKHIVKKNWVATKNAGEDLRLAYTAERSMGIIYNNKKYIINCFLFHCIIAILN